MSASDKPERGDTAASAQVLRALDMLELLADALPGGLRNKDLAEALNCPPSYVNRTADSLMAKGWVEKTEDGQLRCKARFGALTFRVMAAFDRAEQQMADMRQNYTGDGAERLRRIHGNRPV